MIKVHLGIDGYISDMVFDQTRGHVYVCDWYHNMVRSFDRDGRKVRTWDVVRPTSVAINSNRELLICNRQGIHAVNVDTGNLLTRIKEFGDDVEHAIVKLSVDGAGNMLITMAGITRVLTREGEHISTLVEHPGYPFSEAVMDSQGRLIVTKRGSARHNTEEDGSVSIYQL